MQQATTYRERSRDFLAKASVELEVDLAQASEKGWGAAAAIVKAVAAERGWNHQSHRSLYAAVNNLENETGDSEFGTLFGAAGDLHTNFYENWYPEAFVKSRLRDIERFVNKVEALLSPLS